MAVPETAMHKNQCMVAWQGKIGLAGQVWTVKPVAVATCVQTLANKKLRLRVLTPDTGHHPAACLAVNDIRQQPFLSLHLPAQFLRREYGAACDVLRLRQPELPRHYRIVGKPEYRTQEFQRVNHRAFQIP